MVNWIVDLSETNENWGQLRIELQRPEHRIWRLKLRKLSLKRNGTRVPAMIHRHRKGCILPLTHGSVSNSFKVLSTRRFCASEWTVQHSHNTTEKSAERCSDTQMFPLVEK